MKIWFHNPNAQGANNGTSPANAWTDRRFWTVPINLIKFVWLVLFLSSLSCQSESLPPQPGTNAVVVWNYPATNNATGFQADYLTGPTNNWPASTNWQPFLRVPAVPGQTQYVSTNVLPPSIVVLWATNSFGNSPWSGPVSYNPDPITRATPSLIIQ